MGLFFVGLTVCFNVWLVVSQIPGVLMIVNQWSRTERSCVARQFMCHERSVIYDLGGAYVFVVCYKL